MFRNNSGIENFQAKEREASRFCRNFFYLTGPKKIRQGTILCFRKFLVGKNILWITGGGGGYHNFPLKFSSHCTEIFHWRTLWCFRKILSSKNFMHRRGGHHGFLKTFRLTRPKRKVLYRNLSVFGKFSGNEKIYG